MDNTEDIIYVKLNDGYRASKAFYMYIHKMMVAALSGKAPGVQCTVKQFIGKDLWNELDTGERKLAGRCVAHMVSKNLLQLDFAGKTKANAQQYRLK